MGNIGRGECRGNIGQVVQAEYRERGQSEGKYYPKATTN